MHRYDTHKANQFKDPMTLLEESSQMNGFGPCIPRKMLFRSPEAARSPNLTVPWDDKTELACKIAPKKKRSDRPYGSRKVRYAARRYDTTLMHAPPLEQPLRRS